MCVNMDRPMKIAKAVMAIIWAAFAVVGVVAVVFGAYWHVGTAVIGAVLSWLTLKDED